MYRPYTTSGNIQYHGITDLEDSQEDFWQLQ